MFQFSELIFSFFTSSTFFTDVMQQRMYPVIAPEDVQFPFATYSLESQEGESKDADMFSATLFFWFQENQYNEALQFTDQMIELVKASQNIEFESSSLMWMEANNSYAGVINIIKL
jgi:hypothetical protein